MNRKPQMSRRSFLRGAGVALALPVLDGLVPRESRAAEGAVKRRLVAINIGLGLHTPNLFPAEEGKDYRITRYLEPLADLRNQFTVISGTSYPGVDGGHHAEKSFLTGTPHPLTPNFRNGISLDQFAADRIGEQTRFGYLALSLGGPGLSVARSGQAIPAESRPSRVFTQMFLAGNATEKANQVQRLKDGQSVLDAVREEADRLSRRLGAQDRDKLDQYLNAVRETERRLHRAEDWEQKPKPKVEARPPVDITDNTDIIGRAGLMYDMMHLALQTDSTRLITFAKSGINAVPKIMGVKNDYHNLSHHGRDPEKIDELAVIELAQLRAFQAFLTKLRATPDGPGTLLDHTIVYLGSNLGNANSHDNRNLPVILAGGSFRHGRHLKFTGPEDYPLSNIYVSLLQRLGIEVDSFSTGKGTLRGLEMA